MPGGTASMVSGQGGSAAAGAGGAGMPYGMILGGVGGILSTAAASREAKAMYDEYLKELKRQGVYQQQDVNLFNKNVQATGAQGYQGMLKEGAQNREGLYSQMQQVPLTLQPIPQGGDLYAQRNAASAQQAGKFRAALGGYQDAALGTELANQQTNRGMAQVGNFSQGMANVFPYRMYDAQNSQWQLALAGSLLSSMGNMSTDISSHYQDYKPPSGNNSPTLSGSQGFGGGGGDMGIYNYGSGNNSLPWGNAWWAPSTRQ